MSTIQWHHLWQQAQSNPYRHAAAALLIFNGLAVEQIAQLAAATVDLDGGWITTQDGSTYPLVSYAQQALAALYEHEEELSTDAVQLAVEPLIDAEHDAHRRLTGSIWITDDALQVINGGTTLAESPILPLRFTFPFSIADRLQSGEVSTVAQQARITLQTAADWLHTQITTPQASIIQRALGVLKQGSLVFLLASTGVSGLNLIHNVLMGRLLSPADYSQLTFIITLQLLIGLLPTMLQTVVARFSARYNAQDAPGAMTAFYHVAGRFGWQAGIIAGLVTLVVSPLLVSVFQLGSFWLLVPVIIMVPFFVRMGVDRGFLQGMNGYFWLSGAYVSEGVIRLGVSVALGYALLSAGRELEGAIWGVAQSMLATWFISWLALRHVTWAQADETTTQTQQSDWVKLGGLTLLVLIGQALITNSDFFLVKTFFDPDEAGLYAAVSVLGRIVYFGALPLTVLLVPLVARRQALDEPTTPILVGLVGGGVVVCGVLILIAAIFARDVLGLLYGDAYVDAANLLAPYALAASLYTLTNLVITYQIALGSGGETWMPISAGIAQIVLVLLFHNSLGQVIIIQIGLMSLLFGLVLWRVFAPGTDT